MLSLQCGVRDLYGRQELGNFTEYFTAPILAHGAGVLKITPLRCTILSICYVQDHSYCWPHSFTSQEET